ncbi:type II secretion system ATPase GspE [bacterium]|nr:type II secretion system ATPase GspE [bacterium]
MMRKDVGEILLEEGVITPEQLKEVRDVAKATKADIKKLLIDLGYAKEEQVYAAWAKQLGYPFIDFSKERIDPSAVNLVPQHFAQRYNVIPVRKISDRKLLVAMADPTNIVAIDDLRLVTGLDIEPAVAVPDLITEAINRHYRAEVAPATAAVVTETAGAGGLPTAVQEAISTLRARGEISAEEEEALRVAEEAPIIRAVNAIIHQAIKERASDIHVEPERRSVRIRYRIDGILHEVMNLPRFLHPPLTSRIKIMADMNIAERRLPQDGRIPIRTPDGKDYDLRVSCIPTITGEKIVMRILDRQNPLIGLHKLGFFPDTFAQLEKLISYPYGIILSTGPTGSGKTTTQYSILNRLNTTEVNIITIEDPVEYQLPGIYQVQVNTKAGLLFSNALRYFLRHDPDIMMVGEIRDLETAEIAVEASLTGHLVLSTLHTNDAPTAITRLIDMGVEPFLVSASLIGVLAQRLVRTLCPHCKEPYKPPAEGLRRLGLTPEEVEGVTFYRGRGCEYCRHTGYYGRTGIFELMVVNEEIAELIVRRAPLGEIREAAKANGMKTLMEDGLRKAMAGITTIEEVLRVAATVGF